MFSQPRLWQFAHSEANITAKAYRHASSLLCISGYSPTLTIMKDLRKTNFNPSVNQLCGFSKHLCPKTLNMKHEPNTLSMMFSLKIHQTAKKGEKILKTKIHCQTPTINQICKCTLSTSTVFTTSEALCNTTNSPYITMS